jgi:hypothetical protein
MISPRRQLVDPAVSRLPVNAERAGHPPRIDRYAIQGAEPSADGIRLGSTWREFSAAGAVLGDHPATRPE